MVVSLKAPFPFYGGKSRSADLIWSRLGDPKVYAEPFAGSLAVMLKRPPSRHPKPREMVVDIDHHIVNFWRAVKADPEAVARHCDWPQFHADLSARHRWLVAWGRGHRDRIISDPEYCCPKAAGWWVWGVSLWIGGGWCADRDTPNGKMPETDPKGGVSGGTRAIGQMPLIRPTSGNPGIHALGQMPFIDNGGHNRGAQAAGDKIEGALLALADRFRHVIILAGNWKQCLGTSPLMHTSTAPKPSVGILLDPPYLTENRASKLYRSDADGTSDDVAVEAWEWALEHGDTYRIAYCCHEGDFEAPGGWEVTTRSLAGIRRRDVNTKRDCVMFSPACAGVSMPLFNAREAG